MPAAQAPNTLPPRPAKDEGAIQIVQIPEARVKYENTIRLRRYGYLAFILFVVYVVVQHRKAQKLEREKIHPYWGRPSLESQSCIAYNTRRYNARLWNVPLNFDWHTICMSIPIKIHNLELTVPERCEIRVSSSSLSVSYKKAHSTTIQKGDYVYGTWRVDDNEPSCQARWGDLIEDKVRIRAGREQSSTHSVVDRRAASDLVFMWVRKQLYRARILKPHPFHRSLKLLLWARSPATTYIRCV